MKIERNGQVVEIDGRFRVEPGPPRVETIAGKAILSNDRTASHYQLGARDALGQPIVAGKPFTYIDWLSGATVYYVYALEPVTVTVNGKAGKAERWMPKGHFADYEAALSHVTTLAT